MSLADRLADQVAGRRLQRTGLVTGVSRRDFRIDLGREDGMKTGLEAEVLRYTEAGVVAVARAKIVDVEQSQSRLRRIDRGRSLKIRQGDAVLVEGLALKLLVAGIGGVPAPVSEVIVSRLTSSLREKHGLTVKTDPRARPEGPWPWSEASELALGAIQRGCPNALAGWAEVEGDSLHVVLGLIAASNQETVALYTASAKIDAALAALIGSPPSVHKTAGVKETDIDNRSPYETGLAPAFEMPVPMRVLAVSILSKQRALCVVGEKRLEIYKIQSADRGPTKVAEKVIESPPLPVRCRSAVGETAFLDSDGDGYGELVIWSSVLAGPVAFSVDDRDDALILERSEIFWLPWASPLGDVRYVQGTNYMAASSPSGVERFYEWAAADLDHDGSTESVLTQTKGVMTVRDSSMAVLSRFEDTGSAIEVFDMNGDGVYEIISSSSSEPEDVDFIAFHNWSRQDLAEVWRIGGIPGGVISIAAGHLDEDDLPDLVAVLSAGPRAKRSRLLFLLTAWR